MLNQVIISTIMIVILSNLFANAILKFESMSFTHKLLISSLQYRHSSFHPMSYSKLLINSSIGRWWIENLKLIRLLQLIRVVNVFDLWENKLLGKFCNKNEFGFICVVFCYFLLILVYDWEKKIQRWHDEKSFFFFKNENFD